MSDRAKRTRAWILCAAMLAPPLAGDAAEPWNAHPFRTPDRGYGGDPGDLSVVEVTALLEPCVSHARASFSRAADRFQAGLPEGAQFLVITRHQEPFQQFYVEVERVEATQVLGRLPTDTYLAGAWHERGEPWSVERSRIVDWMILYPDRPEEGNLTGKYLLRMDDGLLDGACDPHSEELSRFRVYQPGYSFVPPTGAGWELHPGHQDADVTVQRFHAASGTLDTVYSTRWKTRRRVSRMSAEELAHFVEQTERKNLGDPDRYTLQAHEVSPFANAEARCAFSLQVIEDREALLPSGERSPMVREVRTLTCLHPRDPRTAVQLTFAHRHRAGEGDAQASEEATRVLRTLVFSKPGAL